MTIPDDRLIVARDLCDLKFLGDPQLSPDGAQVAFVVTTIDAEADEYRSRIWLVPSDGSAPPRPLTSGEKADTAPRWAPTTTAAGVSTRLAFLSTRGGKPQLYVLPIGGGEARKVTDLAEGAGEAVWSPDGTRLAFAAAVKATPGEEEGDAEKRKDAEAREPLRIERLKYKYDGRGYIHGKPSVEQWRHLFVVAVPDDPDAPLVEATQLTRGDWDDDTPAWSPDGSTLAFTSYREPDTDLVVRTDLWTVPAAGGDPRKLTASNGNASNPAWSPDGLTLAYFFAEEADRPFATQRLWTVGADGEQAPRAVAPAFDRDANSQPMADQTLPASVARPIWSSDGRALSCLVGDGGNQHLWRMSADGDEQTRLLGGERGIVAVSAGPPGGPLVFCATDGAHPAELFVADADGGNERQLTDLNRAWLDRKAVSAPERLRVTGGNGDEIDAWLVRPHNVPEGAKHPLVLMIHGGPHGQYGNAFFHEFQFLAARGHGILYANPHGSSGRGAAFAKALAGRWGEVDMPDLMAAVDHVLALGEADPDRLGVGGGSYGGYMTNWLIGHTDRFKAAVTMRSIANLLNFWGTSDIFHLGNVPEFGAPWENLERYAKFSPIMYAANFVTPTLILHQEEDYRCPVEQGEQLFAALKLRGIPTRFVRFPGENHGMSRNGKPQHRLQRLEEIVAWYDRYLAAGGGQAAAKR